jgi:hypothetical protein
MATIIVIRLIISRWKRNEWKGNIEKILKELSVCQCR